MKTRLLGMIAAVAAGSAVATAGPALAGECLPVVELFTSQGCSSCPPADRLFESYAARKDLVALSLNVDYWDYIGWKDTLASPKYSLRQREYARARGDGQVYTPQMVVNGRAHAVGHDRRGIDAALEQSAAAMRAAPVTFTVASSGAAIEVSGDAAATRSQPAIVWLVAISPEQRVKVERGENSGRVLTYHNVVREMSEIGTLSGPSATFPVDKAKLARTEGLRHAALIQSGRGGPLVAAAWLD